MKHKGISAERYEILTSKSGGEVSQEEVWKYRTRITDAGPMKYIDVYPIFRNGKSLRQAKTKRTKEAQERGNRRRAMLHVEQLINTNFSEKDCFCTMTFREEEAPVGEDEVRKMLRAYIAKLRRLARKHGEDLRYLYVMELPVRQDWDTRSYRESAGWHVHIMIGGVTRDEAEDAWEHGITNSRRLQDSKERFAGIAKYMLKRRDSARLWARSRNLKEPTVTIRDRHPGKVKVGKISEDVRAFGKEILEGLYPGYTLTEGTEVKTSELFQGIFIHARLRRWR